MQEYEKKTINEVVEKINDTYFLPDIQRDFVWKPDAIYKLFDSLMRQYPINTFLFWQLDGKTISKNNYKKIEFVKESKQDSYSVNTSINPDKTYFLVLDGQQRLTTFYLVLKGDYFMNKTDTTPRDLYFNILSGKDEDEEDGILYEFKFFDRKKGGDFLFKKKSRKTKEKIIKLWVSVKAIYQISDTVGFLELEKFCAALESTHKIKLTKEQQNSVYVLKEQLRNQRIINFFPEKEDNYDKVLDIFVRTNSGGTKLEYSDLLFANIKAIWKDAREEFDKLLDSINDSGRYDFEKDNILKTILLLNASAVTEVKYKTKNFKPALISKVKDPKYWSKLCDAFKITIDLLSDLFLITDKKLLSANNAIIPIVY